MSRSRALTAAQSARAGLALVLANARYWTTVAPLVRAQLARWEERAETIPDPALRALALGKLREERFNAEGAASLATLAPRARRRSAVEAIVALQVMYDYLDVLSEQPPGEQPRDDRELFEAFTDAFAPDALPGGDGYPRELARTVKLALGELPAAAAIAEVARRSAKRCAEAQVLSHEAAREGDGELERWARREAEGAPSGAHPQGHTQRAHGRQAPHGGGHPWHPENPGHPGHLGGQTQRARGKRAALQWPEFLAGASASVLALHALIAAAADPRTTREDAEAIDAAYLLIAALTMLDSLIDREQDLAAGEPGYIRHYDDAEQMAERLAAVAHDAAARASALPHAAHHTMTLVGVVAYYSSAPAASGAFARPVTARLRRELRPLIAPTLAVMRLWRLAKRGGARCIV